MAGPLDRLLRRVKCLGRLGARAQDLSVDLTTDLAIVLKTMADDGTGRLEAAVEIALVRAAQARHQAKLRAASVGAWKMEMRFNSRGAALVRIDDGKWFRLSRRDGRLLHVLAHATAAEPDGFPAWQTYAQLADALGGKTGVTPTRRALVQSVHRVRRALDAADLNPYLLRVDRKTGRLRFLLRHGLRGVPAQGSH